MKLNERSLSFYATCASPADHAGFLHKKGERNTAYHRRWFVLRGNMLFYFEERESREPVGVIILEGCRVELCQDSEEFAFAIRFDGPKSRTYVLAAENQAALERWVKALSRASFDYLRLVVRELEKQLEEMQAAIPGAQAAPRRRLLYRKNRTAPNLELAALPREKPSLPVCIPGKENGCALWNNSEASASLSPACREVNPCSGAKSYDGGLKPPPLPPRRRSLPSSSGGAGGPSSDGAVSLSAVCFSQLHGWYGQEIVELRKAWLEGQKEGDSSL
ncbi:PREDICTED: sesquipedalian-1-like [Thamnophis sirtalis]|uniref:Sesquipedalian n=1 Tax=Thamnophis sirtalis TaxID=35019 RepID=A0A6I9Y9B3_9SAUR|nr:PREDICTED: sesquipedalian-1-like [Thamnophis sirtalis]